MGIDQKARSLFCGLPSGIQFQELDDATVLPLSAVPYELEPIIANWILALPKDLHADALRYVDGAPYALTQSGWDAFVSWMLNGLHTAQQFPDFEHTVSECASKHLTGSKATYL